ncbi:MAG TPA: hypothetical protein VK514_13065 [Candidatus Acidoferrum sp.]|nr:hypothetical protein [Candidatus Acidoferrum sp.]
MCAAGKKHSLGRHFLIRVGGHLLGVNRDEIFFDPSGALRLDFKIEELFFRVLYKGLRFIDSRFYRRCGCGGLRAKLAGAKK